MFLVRNYNRFLAQGPHGPQWVNLGHLRYWWDLQRLIWFTSQQAAEDLLAAQPELETDFDAWVVPLVVEHWTCSSPWEPVRPMPDCTTAAVERMVQRKTAEAKEQVYVYAN